MEFWRENLEVCGMKSKTPLVIFKPQWQWGLNCKRIIINIGSLISHICYEFLSVTSYILGSFEISYTLCVVTGKGVCPFAKPLCGVSAALT